MIYLRQFIVAVLSFLSLIVLCPLLSSENPGDHLKSDHNRIPSIKFSAEQIIIEGVKKPFSSKLDIKRIDKDLSIITITLKSDKPSSPPKISVKWKTPSIDIYSFWTPKISLDKSSYWNSRIESRAVRYAPVISLYNKNDKNRVTIAVSDTMNKVISGVYLKEEDLNFHFYFNFFTEKTPPLKEYKVKLRIDTRRDHFSDILGSVSKWWADMDDMKPVSVPATAKLPIYSTWYSFHQNITADEIVEQCKLAKPLGFDVLIVDDGWQTIDSKRGYRYTGDWNPDRIGNMKSFVDRIHNIGTKFMLWYSLPFIGERSKNFNRFKGKYLTYWKSQGAYVLDPRYPDVRKFIISTYEKALREWDLDGFKLDFMGWFKSDDKTELTIRNGRDFASVDKAVDRLMTDIMIRMKKIRSDIMIEFRQPYIGPRMRKYGNMFRATDCPNMALINRVRVTDLRLLSGNTAVHSDMYAWHENEPKEQAALQLLNVLYSVPQLSVRLEKIPPDHLKMVYFWTNYWRKNKDILLDGSFLPSKPYANYPVIKAGNSKKTIITVYDEHFIDLPKDQIEYIDIVNAKLSEEIVIINREKPEKYEVKVYDCIGRETANYTLIFKKGVHKFSIPASGLLRLFLK